VGAVADVRFSAFKNAYTIYGRLTNVSADRLIDEMTGMPYFGAQIVLPPEELARLGTLQILPGMPAEVLIKTGERTLFQYLTQPAANAFARAMIED